MLSWMKGNWYINPLLRLGYTMVDDALNGGSVDDNSYSRWLLNGEWDEEKYKEYLIYNAIPGISHYTDYLTSLYDDLSYMKNNQLDWDDVKRPWKLNSASAGSSAIRFGMNFVSDNAKTLYSSFTGGKKKRR